jgi:hypothetical protein
VGEEIQSKDGYVPIQVHSRCTFSGGDNGTVGAQVDAKTGLVADGVTL